MVDHVRRRIIISEYVTDILVTGRLPEISGMPVIEAIRDSSGMRRGCHGKESPLSEAARAHCGQLPFINSGGFTKMDLVASCGSNAIQKLDKTASLGGRNISYHKRSHDDIHYTSSSQ